MKLRAVIGDEATKVVFCAVLVGNSTFRFLDEEAELSWMM